MTNEFDAESYSEQKDKFLTFYVAEQVYAIEIKRVSEIISILPITAMPEMPAYIEGIINLRGRVIPVMDVRRRFKKDPMEYNFRTNIIIVEVNNILLGLIVDSVLEVIFINNENVILPPDVSNGTKNRYVKAIALIEDKIRLILDCEKLLNYEEISQIL